MGTTKFNEFPAEIKVYIFRLATTEVSQPKETHLDYRPFEAIALHWHDRDWSSLQQGLDTKRTLVLVSKEWKKFATEILYECIRVHHGTDALIEALEGPLAEVPATDGDRRTFNNGQWVRRVEISSDIVDFDPFRPLPLLRIIQSCPLAETVVRQNACVTGLALDKVPSSITFTMFPNIRKIEWWLPSVMPYSKTSAMDTGLPGFLRQLIDHCPSLQYLTLSGSLGGPRDRIANNKFEPIHFQEFASIRTLRLEGEVGSVPMPKCGLSLPGLQNLVLIVTHTPDWRILRENGYRVRVLELIKHRSYPESQAWSTKDVLALCPNLEEFCFSSDMCDALAKQNEMGVALHKLKCIRLKLQLDHWSVMQATQFGVFVRDELTCPALERIVLHGKEDEWRENESFPMLESYLKHLKYVTLDFASL